MTPKTNINAISVVCINLIFILTALLTQSRAFVFGFGISLIVILFCVRLIKFKCINIGIVICTIPLLISSLTLFFKRDSSFGRLLVYKISYEIWKDNWLKGIGLGTFAYQYREYQANYFAKGNYTEKELLLADNVKNAYNDYFEFVIQTGIPGFMLLFTFAIIMVILVYKSIVRAFQMPVLIHTCIMILISISAAALVTHVFEKWYFQLAFLISILILFSYCYQLNILFFSSVLALTFCSILFFHFGHSWIHYKHLKQYTEAKDLYKTGYKREACAIFFSIYPYLKEKSLFLYDYSNILMDLGKPKMAEKMAKELINIDNNNMAYMLLGDCYHKNRQYKLAERCYIKALNMVPNRFNSRFKLFQFYIATNQTTKAKVTGEKILLLPVKIPSLQVNQIRRQVFEILRKEFPAVL